MSYKQVNQGDNYNWWKGIYPCHWKDNNSLNQPLYTAIKSYLGFPVPPSDITQSMKNQHRLDIKKKKKMHP